MSDLRTAAQQALEALELALAPFPLDDVRCRKAADDLRAALAEPVKPPLTDEVIADLWHQNGGYHHHFARAVERWLKGQA